MVVVIVVDGVAGGVEDADLVIVGADAVVDVDLVIVVADVVVDVVAGADLVIVEADVDEAHHEEERGQEVLLNLRARKSLSDSFIYRVMHMFAVVTFLFTYLRLSRYVHATNNVIPFMINQE